MAVSIVQLTCAGEDTANDADIALSVTNVPTVGNHLIAFGGSYPNDNTVSSISDTVNTWNIRTNNFTDAKHLILADCKVAGDMTGKTITLTLSGNSTEKNLFVFEVSGLDGTTWFGGKTTLVANFFPGTARTTTNAITPNAAGDLILGLFVTGDAAETSFTAGSGYTRLPTATGAGYFAGASNLAEGEYKIATDTSAQTPTATGGASPTAVISGAFYYKQAAAAATTRLRTLMGVGT